MLDTSQIISVVLVFAPVLATIPSLTGVFDLSYKDGKKRFEEIGKSLKERKIENWRYVFLGEKGEGGNIAVSDKYVEDVLRAMSDGESLHNLLGFCRKSFHFYYVFLLVIFCGGVLHGFLNLMGWFPGAIENINGYKVQIIAGTLLYVVLGLIWLFGTKYRLEKKYEKYLGI